MSTPAAARFGSRIATELVEVSHDLTRLSEGGMWAVSLPYSGLPVLARVARWGKGDLQDVAGPWRGPSQWSTSMDRERYQASVSQIRQDIATGRIYQANLCRILSARLPDGCARDIGGLHALLERDNPAPYAGMLRLPDHGIHIASASPELFLRRHGDVVESAPIKGTAAKADQLLEKDRAENVMIVDLVRNDLSRVCRPGSVEVPALLAIEEHPSLVHLVSRVRGRLHQDASWTDLFEATFPPGSVTGAPKHTAIQVIAEQEPVPREAYCGAFGWVDADRGEAELAVSIRTFWVSGSPDEPWVNFGTGAGITWGSDPDQEWRETQLKARHLIHVASGQWPGGESATTPMHAGVRSSS